MTADRLIGLIDRKLPEKYPQWHDQRDVAMAKPLTDDHSAEWVVVRIQITNLAVAVCTPPPHGGYLEQWDYPGDTEGALNALRAWTRWPNRDRYTEAWIRHTRTENGARIQRRNPRIEDFPPGEQPE